MGAFLFTALKNILGYIAGRLLKPETIIELILDLCETAAKRTDSKVDDKIVSDVRKALGHEEEE